MGLPELPEPDAPPKPAKVRGPRAPRKFQARYDYDQIRALREGGRSIAEIAAEIGAHGNTVRLALHRMGIYEQDRRGRPAQEKCGKGLHKMEGNSRTLKNGGRMCIPCHQERGHLNHQKRKTS